jgi:hypothetical protein
MYRLLHTESVDLADLRGVDAVDLELEVRRESLLLLADRRGQSAGRRQVVAFFDSELQREVIQVGGVGSSRS